MVIVSSHGAGFRICVDLSSSAARRIFPFSTIAGNFSCAPDTDILFTERTISSVIRNLSIPKSRKGETLASPKRCFIALGEYVVYPAARVEGQIFILFIFRNLYCNCTYYILAAEAIEQSEQIIFVNFVFPAYDSLVCPLGKHIRKKREQLVRLIYLVCKRQGNGNRTARLL